MTKIYQTKEDYQKDVLKDQAKDLRIKSGDEFVYSIGIGAVGSLINTAFKNRASNVASIVLNTLGMIGIVKSFFTRSKAHDLELQRELMGPETTVYPTGILPPEVTLPPGDNMADAVWQDKVTSKNGQVATRELSLCKSTIAPIRQ